MATIPAEGTTLAISMTDGGSYVPIAQVTAVQPPGGSVPVVGKTYLTSTMKEKRPGLIPDPGSISLSLEFDPNLAGHQALRALMTSPAVVFFKLTYNDGMAVPATDEFAGFLTDWSPAEAEDESNIAADVTIEITGEIESTPGAAS